MYMTRTRAIVVAAALLACCGCCSRSSRVCRSDLGELREELGILVGLVLPRPAANNARPDVAGRSAGAQGHAPVANFDRRAINDLSIPHRLLLLASNAA